MNTNIFLPILRISFPVPCVVPRHLSDWMESQALKATGVEVFPGSE